MTPLIERLRAIVEAVPAGGSVSLPRDWLAAELGPVGEPKSAAPTLLTVADVAAQLHRSPSTVRGWVEAGRFTGAFKLNARDWRIPAVAVDAFIAGQRPKTSRDDAPGTTISTPADTGVPPGRAQPGGAVDLSDWRKYRRGPA